MFLSNRGSFRPETSGAYTLRRRGRRRPKSGSAIGACAVARLAGSGGPIGDYYGSANNPENPLAAVNRLCYLLRLFLDSHTGFDRTRLGGYLDLFWVMMNPPRDKMEKAAFVLVRAMRNPKTLRYRDFYARSPSSDDEESSS